MPPERIPHEDLAKVAQGLVRGERQTQIGADLGWTKFRVNRCLLAMRNEVARAKSDPSWMSTVTHGPVKVALEWIQLQPKKDGGTP